MPHSFWSGSAASFLATPPASIVAILAEAQIRHFRINEAQQLRAWEAGIAMLRAALDWPGAASWHVLLEYPMLRLGRRPDAILLTDRAILVLEFKADAARFTPADRRQVEDYAIDLHDFHAGSRRHPIVPILVAEHAPGGLAPLPLLLGGVTEVIDANAATLRPVLHELATRIPQPALPLDATYRVLLTRARYETAVFVPHGSAADGTRDPAVLDGIADFLCACGARPLGPPRLEAALPAQAEMLLA